MYYWWMVCLDCGVFAKEEAEYLGFDKLFCKKCGSRHIKSGFICEPKEKKDKCES